MKIPQNKFERDEVAVIHSNIDDASGEILGHALDLILKAGAFDVALVPIQMKKNRPGAQLQAIAPKDKIEDVAEAILTHTSSFGIRYEIVHRLKLRQEIGTVATPYGDIRVKKGFLGDKLVQASPEYEDCRKASAKHDIPIKDIYNAAISHASH